MGHAGLDNLAHQVYYYAHTRMPNVTPISYHHSSVITDSKHTPCSARTITAVNCVLCRRGTSLSCKCPLGLDSNIWLSRNKLQPIVKKAKSTYTAYTKNITDLTAHTNNNNSSAAINKMGKHSEF